MTPEPRATRSADDEPGWILVVIGVVLTLVFGAAYIAMQSGGEPVQRYTFPLLGHLLVLVLLVAGVRRWAAVLAILLGVASLPVLALFGLLALFTPRGSGGGLLTLCALGQVSLIAGGIVDLRAIARHGLRPVPDTRPWLALIGGAVLLVILVGNPLTRLAEFQEWQAEGARRTAAMDAEKKYWASWHHAEINEIQYLAHCIERFRIASAADAYPASLEELMTWARATPAPHHACSAWLMANGDSTTSRLDPHHAVRYRPPARPPAAGEFGGYTLTVDVGWAPGDERRADLPHGKWNYFLDSASLIHRTRAPRTATSADSLAPICEPNAEVNGCQSPLARRYRWGAGTIPVVKAIGDEVVEGRRGEPVTATFGFEPLIADDSVVAFEATWGDDTTRTRTTVDRTHQPRRVDGQLVFDLEHVYRETGPFTARLTVINAAGERFVGWRYVRIRP